MARGRRATAAGLTSSDETVTLNDAPHVIIGVLPREFHFAPAQPADFWMSLHADNPCELRRGCHNLYGVARLRRRRVDRGRHRRTSRRLPVPLNGNIRTRIEARAPRLFHSRK